MSSLGHTLGSLASIFSPTPGMGLPPLPGDLGLPPSVQGGVGQGIQQGKNPKIEYDGGPKMQSTLDSQRTQAETFNKSFAELLNNQPQLDASERKEFYDAYSNKFKVPEVGKYIAPLTDFSNILSQAPANTAQAQPTNNSPAAPPPAAAATVGPTQQMSPATTPPPSPAAPPQPGVPGVSATSDSPASSVGTLGSDRTRSGGRSPKGRVTTLLTGLGGAAEALGG